MSLETDADVPDTALDPPERARPRLRVNPGSRGGRALAVAVAVVVAATAALVWRDSPQVSPVPPLPALDAVPAAVSSPVEPPSLLVVSVLGAVVRPGLVTVPAEARIADAVAAAGGRRDDADMFGLNWAEKVSDGDQIVVGSTTGSVPTASPARPPSADGDAAEPVGGTVSLNEATEAELDALPGVGPVTASAIVEWRTENGQFSSVDQLSEVPGIGPTRLSRLKDLVTP